MSVFKQENASIKKSFEIRQALKYDLTLAKWKWRDMMRASQNCVKPKTFYLYLWQIPFLGLSKRPEHFNVFNIINILKNSIPIQFQCKAQCKALKYDLTLARWKWHLKTVSKTCLKLSIKPKTFFFFFRFWANKFRFWAFQKGLNISM